MKINILSLAFSTIAIICLKNTNSIENKNKSKITRKDIPGFIRGCYPNEIYDCRNYCTNNGQTLKQCTIENGKPVCECVRITYGDCREYCMSYCDKKGKVYKKCSNDSGIITCFCS